jgi:hypothetical protein
MNWQNSRNKETISQYPACGYLKQIIRMSMRVQMLALEGRDQQRVAARRDSYITA